MRAVIVPLTFFGLTTLCLMACSNSNDYEKYSSCLLKTMNAQDKSMRHHAMENCELKHPYEREIYWKNEVDFDFSFNPTQNKVSFKTRENNSDYRVTKIEVSGSYMACDSIPKEPRKPNFLPEYAYFEQAKVELGFVENLLRKSPDKTALTTKDNIQSDASDFEKKFAFGAKDENPLATLEETNRLMSENLDRLKASEKSRQRLHEEVMREKQLTIIRLEEHTRRQPLIIERAAVIKETEDRKKRLAYEVDLNEHKQSQSSWSSPVEIKFNKGIGEINLNSFGPFSSTSHAMGWAKGPECMRYLKVHGVRFR